MPAREPKPDRKHEQIPDKTFELEYKSLGQFLFELLEGGKHDLQPFVAEDDKNATSSLQAANRLSATPGAKSRNRNFRLASTRWLFGLRNAWQGLESFQLRNCDTTLILVGSSSRGTDTDFCR